VDVTIVRAERKDLENVIPLFDEYREFYEADSDHAAARAFLTERMDRGESVIFLAYAKRREAVGFTQLYPSFSSVSLKRLWILNDLFVRSDARRSGVARALLNRARQHAVETGREGPRPQHRGHEQAGADPVRVLRLGAGRRIPAVPPVLLTREVVAI
jgi:GNAT superfamily N-acetyltransferase